MYSSVEAGRGSALTSTIQRSNVNTVGEESFARTFSSVFQTDYTVANKTESQASSNTRQLSAVDLAVQRDIKEAFGIEPHKSGEPLQPLLKSLWTINDLNGDGSVSCFEMAENADTASKILQKHLGRFMDNENINCKPPVELSIGFDGRVIVKGNHPDKAKIENYISDNSELRNLYVGICNTRNFLALAEEAQRFQQRYEVDPQAAVAEFSHLFTNSYVYETRLIIDDKSWEYQTSSSLVIKT